MTIVQFNTVIWAVRSCDRNNFEPVVMLSAGAALQSRGAGIIV